LPFEPSSTELAEYNRAHEIAARGPTAVLEHLAAGTLDEQHIETSKAIYPRLHAYAQQVVTERLAEHLAKDEKVPMELREPLGLFLDSELTHASTGDAILSTQAVFAAPQPSQPAGQAAGGKPREVKTELADRASTGSQKTEMHLGRA